MKRGKGEWEGRGVIRLSEREKRKKMIFGHRNRTLFELVPFKCQNDL